MYAYFDLQTTELSALCGVFQLGLGKGAESTKDGKVGDGENSLALFKLLLY